MCDQVVPLPQPTGSTSAPCTCAGIRPGRRTSRTRISPSGSSSARRQVLGRRDRSNEQSCDLFPRFKGHDGRLQFNQYAFVSFPDIRVGSRLTGESIARDWEVTNRAFTSGSRRSNRCELKKPTHGRQPCPPRLRRCTFMHAAVRLLRADGVIFRASTNSATPRSRLGRHSQICIAFFATRPTRASAIRLRERCFCLLLLMTYCWRAWSRKDRWGAAARRAVPRSAASQR